MTTNGLFGLSREQKINESGVRNIFTPHTPIQSMELFLGRQNEVQKIIEQINTPGQHALLYGDRGVGKSSLANIATNLLFSKLIQGKLYTKRCDSFDTFSSIMEEPLAEAGIDIYLEKTSSSQKQGGEAGASIKLFKASIKSDRTTEQTRKQENLTPSFVAKQLQDKNGLLYIDEADRISSHDDKLALAELIKLLSDYNSLFKILIVGVATTAEELTGAHPSIQRCLKETKLGRMSDSELQQIIIQGSEKAKIVFNTSHCCLIVSNERQLLVA